MGLGGFGHWIVILLIVLVLFGVGRVSGLMGELGKGIKSFKDGLADGDKPADQPKQIPPQQTQPPIDITPRQSEATPPADDQTRA